LKNLYSKLEEIHQEESKLQRRLPLGPIINETMKINSDTTLPGSVI